MSQSRNWCFTINNYTSDDLEKMDLLAAQIGGDIKYLVYGRETGDNGTPHLQGFIQFSKKKRLGEARNLISHRSHLEVMEGTALQAATYCKKEGEFNEWGQIQYQGANNFNYFRLIMVE